MRYTEEQIAEVVGMLAGDVNSGMRKRLQALLCRMRDIPVNQAAEISGLNRATIFRVCDKYIENGIEGLQSKREMPLRRKLSEERETAIFGLLAEKGKSGCYSRIAELQKEFETLAGVKYHQLHFYRVLARNDWRKVVPRSRHPKAADTASCEDAKKLTLK